MKSPWTPAVLAAGFLFALSAPPHGAEGEAPSAVVRLDEIRAAHPLKDGDAQSIVELLRGQGASAHLVQVRTRVRPHYHKDHEETAYLLEGSGIFILGDRTYPVKAGSLMMVPRGAVHSFDAKQPTSVLSVFNPPFDPADRIFVDTPSPTP